MTVQTHITHFVTIIYAKKRLHPSLRVKHEFEGVWRAKYKGQMTLNINNPGIRKSEHSTLSK